MGISWDGLYAGEDDVALRFTVFGVAVLPAFAILGAWLEHRALKQGTSSARGWPGLLGGTVVAWIVLATLRAIVASKRRV